MASQNFFLSFLKGRGPTVKAMQEVLQQLGEASSGTKDVVQHRLLKKAAFYKTPEYIQSRKSTRILSIDMGIKNLAYCVASVEQSTPDVGAAKMHVEAWRRLDLSEAFREQGLPNKQELVEDAEVEGREDEDLFTPKTLSRMAQFFLRKALSNHRPDVILIERQRWRSSGSPTIQQWTVRVNTLEAIMWAVLETIRTDYRADFDDVQWSVHAVDPKRVGHFWLNNDTKAPAQNRKRSSAAVEEEDSAILETVGAKKKLSRSKAEKKAKIQLLRTWLNSDNPSNKTPSDLGNETDTAISKSPQISFSFSEQPRFPIQLGYGAEATRQALLYATDTPAERLTRKEYFKSYVNKVDDITDCFLQAAAWVAWEENLRCMSPHIAELRHNVEERLGYKLSMPDHIATSVKELQNADSGETNNDVAASGKRTRKPAKQMPAGEEEGLKTPKLAKGVKKQTTSTNTKTRTKAGKTKEEFEELST